jgi:hypothetical protein
MASRNVTIAALKQHSDDRGIAYASNSSHAELTALLAARSHTISSMFGANLHPLASKCLLPAVKDAQPAAAPASMLIGGSNFSASPTVTPRLGSAANARRLRLPPVPPRDTRSAEPLSPEQRAVKRMAARGRRAAASRVSPRDTQHAKVAGDTSDSDVDAMSVSFDRLSSPSQTSENGEEVRADDGSGAIQRANKKGHDGPEERSVEVGGDPGTHHLVFCEGMTITPTQELQPVMHGLLLWVCSRMCA